MAGRIAPDRRLSLRMLLTPALLAALWAGVVAAMVLLIRSLVVVVGVVVGALLVVQFWYSDRIALTSLRARTIGPDEYPRLHAVVDRLCALADMDVPRLAVADTDLPNAFATGRSARRAVLCVTRGLLDRLDADELEGVLAHDLSHVAHRDVAVVTAASFVGALAGLVMRLGAFSALTGGRDRRDAESGLVLLAVTVGAAVVYVVGLLLTLALSRYRELAADRSGAQLTGRPSALASALVTLSDDTARIPTRDLRTAQAFTALLFVPATAAGPRGDVQRRPRRPVGRGLRGPRRRPRPDAVGPPGRLERAAARGEGRRRRARGRPRPRRPAVPARRSRGQGDDPAPGSTLGATEQLHPAERHLYSLGYITESLAIRLAGRAAEVGVLGEPSTDGSPVRRADPAGRRPGGRAAAPGGGGHRELAPP
ncbi:hypothetical protein GCM10023175_62820 [Pseudonocardia xishanensis]|uniref:Peptidase M48 domain-containing protein n=1 Tax=Pseudonocardia xishanensis TaxID=630995 RepID=A0ABP8S278_9PSEU